MVNRISTVSEFLSWWYEHAKELSCTCGYQFHPMDDVSMYPHDGGLPDGESNRWWVYVTCPKCKYQWAWWKLIRRWKVIYNE